MGGQPSKSSETAAYEKAMLDRLRTMGMREEEDYIEIGNGNEKGGFRRPKWEAEGLPLEAVASIPADILRDPKNRYIEDCLHINKAHV